MNTLQSRFTTMFNASHIDFEYIVTSVIRTCVEMLRDRGYVDVDACTNVAEILERMENMQVVVHGSSPTKSIAIYFMAEDRVSVKNIRTIMEGNVFDTTIFVSTDGPTTFAKREAHVQWEYGVQFFRFVELCKNITRHVLVPKHELFTGERKHKDEHYPRIVITDPICQYYNFRIGDLIKITRKHGCSQAFDYYRLVVNVSS